jgi:ABC-2 type transport system permease protein
MWAIYRKEMRAYFLSPLAWVQWCVFLGIIGLVTSFYFINTYSEQLYQAPDANPTESLLIPMFRFIQFLLLMIIPLLSAKLFADERNSGTLELLFTYPLTENQMVWGKLLAATSIAFFNLLLLLPQIIAINHYVTLDWHVVFTYYLGFALLIITFLSIGLFFSSITNSTVVAMFLSYGLLIFLWLVEAVLQRISYELGYVGNFFLQMSLTSHLASFAKGVLSVSDLLFYLSVPAFFIFITLKQLEARKWRG